MLRDRLATNEEPPAQLGTRCVYERLKLHPRANSKCRRESVHPSANRGQITIRGLRCPSPFHHRGVKRGWLQSRRCEGNLQCRRKHQTLARELYARKGYRLQVGFQGGSESPHPLQRLLVLLRTSTWRHWHGYGIPHMGRARGQFVERNHEDHPPSPRQCRLRRGHNTRCRHQAIARPSGSDIAILPSSEASSCSNI